MEHLSIPQPYALALCSGRINGWHLEAPPEEEFCTYLVYATKPVFNPQTPLEWLMEIHNEQVFGNLPPTEAMPVDAFVGMVSFSLEPPDEKSVLTLGRQEPLYKVLTSYVFDRPFRYDHLREDIDLKAIWPYHAVSNALRPHNDIFLTIFVGEQTYSLATAGGTIILDLTEEIRELILNDPENEEDLKSIRELCLVCGKRMKYFDVRDGIEIIYELDAEGSPVTYPSVISPEKRLMRVSALISCAKPWR